MAERVGSLIINLALESGAFKSGLDASQRQLKAATKKMEAFGRDMQNMGQQLSLSVTLPLAAIGASSLKVASDAQELQSAFNQTFGSMAGAMTDWAEVTGDAMGRSTQEMERAANTFGMFFNQAAPTKAAAAEMSKSFSVLAQDLSSFFNVDPDVAMEKLRAGLSGEAEPLRAFGIFLNEAAVKAKAMEMGLVGANGELSEQAKIMARAQLILEGTTKAQGDVARTSDGMANRMRATKAAIEEMQVSIGTKLQPVLLKLLDVADNVLTGFNSLPDGAQTAIVALGGIAAVAGPLIYGFGAIATAVAPLTAAFTVIASGGAMTAVEVAFWAIAAVAAPLIPLLAGVAAAGLAIYAAWDDIGPALAEVGAQMQSALGDTLTEVVKVAKQALDDFMGSAFLAEAKAFGKAVAEIGAVLISALGPAVTGVLRALGTIITTTFKVIVDAVKLVAAVLSGDWAGAWNAAKSIVTNVVTGLGSAFWSLTEGAINSLIKLYQGVKTWLQDKLGSTLNWLADKLGWAGKLFFQLYDAVVGHSYIPDMVDEIGQHIARLDGNMVKPIERATAASSAAFAKMEQDVRKTFGKLDAASKDLVKGQSGRLRLGFAGIFGGGGANPMAGLIDAQQRRAVNDNANLFRLSQAGINKAGPSAGEFFGPGSVIDPAVAAKFKKSMDVMDLRLNGLNATNVRVAKSFKDLADQTLSAIDRMAKAFSGGSFLDKLGAVIGLGLQLGSIGVFGKGVQANVNKIQGFAQGTSFAPGGLAMVGERGPELVNLPKGSRVIPNHALGGMGGMRVEVVPSPFFDVRVQQNIGAAAPGIASAGARAGEARMTMRQNRRVA